MTPTQRSLKALRDAGYTAQVVEKWNPHAMVRIDLFGVFDIVAVKPFQPVLFVQVTSGSNLSSRVKKILAEKRARTVLETGHATIQAHGWRKLKVARGGKASHWVPKVEEITLDDFEKLGIQHVERLPAP